MSFLDYASMLRCTYTCYSTTLHKTLSSPAAPPTWLTPYLTPLSPALYLSSIGLLVLADLTIIPARTALTGGVRFLDTLVLCPGLHRQALAANLHHGEYPAVAAMTTGYVFRVENPAMVFWLQRVSRTAQLTTVAVTSVGEGVENGDGEIWYLMCVAATITSSFVMATADPWFLVTISLLVLVRLLNYLVLRHRAEHLWSGAPEPGLRGDLLVLLSQDRWVRMRGLVDDLKAVTSGTWFRPATALEEFINGVATLLAYLACVLAANISQLGQLVFMALLVVNAGCLGLANHRTKRFCMFGRSVSVKKVSRRYGRRLKMVEELVEEVKRDDWAVRLGMIGTDRVRYSKVKEGEVIM